MKTWLARHPNLAFIVLVALYVYTIYYTVEYFDHRRWGWSAALLIASCAWMRRASKWWHRT